MTEEGRKVSITMWMRPSTLSLLKAMAEHKRCSLGDIVESVVFAKQPADRS